MKNNAIQRRKINTLLIFFVMLIFLSTPLLASTNKDEIKAKLDSFVKAFMSCREIPGLTLSVVHLGNVFHSKGYGESDRDEDIKVTANETLFCVASLTKAFTATLVEKLYPGATGKFSPPIRKILQNSGVDECCQFADDYITNHVTMVDLLSHRTGIGRYDFMWIRGDLERKEIIRRIRHMQSVYDFRDQSLYTNNMFALAGHVLEQTKGESWENLLRREILEPLGMRKTTFLGQKPPEGTRFAKQYETHGGKLFTIPMDLHNGSIAVGPAISLCTTAEDMVHWMNFNLHGGKVTESNTGRLLSESSMENIHSPVVISSELYKFKLKKPTYPVTLSYDKYAKGWLVGRYREKPLLMHYGSYPGTYSMVTLYKGIDLGIFTSMHGTSGQMPSFEYLNLLHLFILDHFMGKTPWLNETTVCSFPTPWETPKSKNISANQNNNQPLKGKALPKPADSYTGTYYHPVFGDLIIKRKGKSLEMQFGRIKGDIIPQNTTFFNFKVDPAEWLIDYLLVEFVFEKNCNSASRVRVPYFEHQIKPEFLRKNITSGSTNIDSQVMLWFCMAITQMYYIGIFEYIIEIVCK